MASKKGIFKKCNCGMTWSDQNAFLEDRSLDLVAYQAALRGRPEEGIIVFKHTAKGCDELIGVAALNFLNLYEGQIYYTSSYKTKECERLCNDFHNFQRCNAICSKAHIREIVIKIINMKKIAA